ncbi:MAG: YHS domain-containing protein [Bacteroidota bacterium]
MVKDVVCGMGVEEDAMGTFSRTLEGKKYFFCSAECLLLFSKEPLYYLGQSSEEKTASKDLVCGMEVDESNPPFTAKYRGKIYYFCSHSCEQEFEREPVKFITGE